MKTLRVVAIGFVVLMVIIQFVPYPLPEVSPGNKDDLFGNAGKKDDEVSTLIKTSCYNCHSQQTVYPWYAHVAPVSWLIASDVAAGRKELNFSTWNQYPKRTMIKKLDEISEKVKEGEMPLPIYTLLHSEAKLTDIQKQKVVEWSEAMTESVLSN